MRSSYLDILSQAWQQHTAPRADDAPTLISLFAGCGGSSLGYSMAGFRELLAAEWNDHAAETFRLNFPGVPVHHGDIADLNLDAVLAQTGLAVGALSVLDGSPPCQGFSTSGKRLPDDPRNGLFREFVRLLQGLRPRAFVMENVSGLVKGKMRLVFAEILRVLKESGYHVRCWLLDASHYQIPQARERLIFLGVRTDVGIAPSPPQSSVPRLAVRDALGDLPRDQDPERLHVWIDESPGGRDTKTYALAGRARQGQRYAGQQRRDRWHRPASTLTTALTGSYLRTLNCHPIYTRTYSLREMARLGSFPDAFQWPPLAGMTAKDLAPIVNRIGNSVPPLLMRALARHVRETMLQPALKQVA